MELIQEDFLIKTKTSLARLRPRLEARFNEEASENPANWEIFLQRLETNFPCLFRLYYQLYAGQYDFFYHLEDLLTN